MQDMPEKADMAQDTKAELQNEVIRLQRQYRYLEDDRRAYKDEAEYQLKKQHAIIDSLQKEEEELLKVLTLAKSKRNVVFDLEILSKLQELLDEEELVSNQLSDEKEACYNLDLQVKRKRQETDKKRLEMGGCFMSEHKHKSTGKQIRVLANRLNQMKVKFNNALAENATYRQYIDRIIAQRNLFFDIHKKLRRLYEQAQNEKERLIEASTALFHTREEAGHRMQSLKERSERDLNQYNVELKDLLRIIDHDKNLREFMQIKTEERTEQFEKMLQLRFEKKLACHVKALKIEVGRYEEIFGRLGEVSGLKDIEEIVNKFVKTEDQNFALFNYVNEQNVQRQQLERDIEQLKIEKSTIEKGDVEMSKERKVLLREIKEKLEKTTSNCEAYIKMHKEDRKLFEKLRGKMADLFKRVGCNSTALTNVLGDSEITNDNLVRYVGVLEQRCNELLQSKLVLAAKEGNEHDVTLLQNILTGNPVKENKHFYRAPSCILEQESSANGAPGSKITEEWPIGDPEVRDSTVKRLGKLTKKYTIDGSEPAGKRKVDKKKKEN